MPDLETLEAIINFLIFALAFLSITVLILVAMLCVTAIEIAKNIKINLNRKDPTHGSD